MRQQHAEGDRDAASIGTAKLGDDGGDRGFQIKHAALVEDHRHRGRGNNFG